MPSNFAIFATDKALAVKAANPEISNWIIGGHSMGGGIALRYAMEGAAVALVARRFDEELEVSQADPPVGIATGVSRE